VFHRLKILLYPLALIYALVVRLRNHLYNIGYKKEISFQVMTIGVGNLVMGGSGKTPMTEYLIRMLKDQFKIAVLSRGYGRQSTGIKLLTDADTVRQVGDEPMQVFRKFSDSITVAVGENRLLAIPQILTERPETDLVILDDVFQHRKVKPTVNLLLTTHESPFYFDFIFPAGWLREPRHGARRADAIIVTKCPRNLTKDSMDVMRTSIARYSQAPVFFTALQYEEPIAFGLPGSMAGPVVLVSAIANNYLFKNYCAMRFEVARHFTFEDHHFCTEVELQEITAYAKARNASIITTEKDMVKLREHSAIIAQASWFYMPVQIVFLNGEADFRGMILEKSRALQSSQN
jgi:tetraacyldisaccharide 4'-kinase